MIHLRAVPRKYSFAADANYVETHAKLKQELSHQVNADIWGHMERHERRERERKLYLQYMFWKPSCRKSARAAIKAYQANAVSGSSNLQGNTP